MSNLVTSIDDMRPFIRVASDVENVAEFSTGIDFTIEKYILPILGQTLLDTLEEYCATRSETTESAMERLRTRVLRTLWPFQIAEIADELAVTISGMGISVARTDSVAPVSDEKLKALKNTLYNRAYAESESLIRTLIIRVVDYPSWTQQNVLLCHLFNYSDEFIRLVPISNAALTLNNLKPAIERMERTVLAELVGAELVDFFITNLYDTSADVSIRTAIYYARCIVAYSVALDDLNLSAYASRIESVTAQLLAILAANPAKFPGYVAPAAFDELNDAKFFNTIR
jgi:hypothetical protein